MFKIYYYSLSASDKKALCVKMKVTKSYLSQLATGKRGIGSRTARKLVIATGGALTLNDILE